MLPASDGSPSLRQTHASTARQWVRQIVESKLAMAPFGDWLGSLTKSDVEGELMGPDPKSSREFKAMGVGNFRTKAARALRDDAFGKNSVCFLHEASRYRGKADYRDAIYLACGKAVPKLADGFMDDLTTVLTGFSAMAAGYCSVRKRRDRWKTFVEYLEERRAISLSPLAAWS